MKLGRLPPQPQRLAAAPSLRRYGLAPPPARVDRSGVVFTPGLYANDLLPDCTAAALANCATASSLALTGAAPVIDPATVPAFYAASIGRSGATEDELASTDGAVVLDVLAYQNRSGFDVGEQAPLVATFGTIDAADQDGMAAAVAHLGCCYVGVKIYQSDMDCFEAGLPPDPTNTDALLGGHALAIWDYAGMLPTDTLRLMTWGALWVVSWAWLLARAEEAHGLLWNDRAPGLDYAALRADVAAFMQVKPSSAMIVSPALRSPSFIVLSPAGVSGKIGGSETKGKGAI